jgi:hypothetical protein
MLVMCSLLLTIKVGDVNMLTRSDVEGRILKEDGPKYLVDFSEGVKRFDIAGKTEDYKKVLINKTECVKE